MNKVYHLKVEAHSKRFKTLIEKNSLHSDLFFTHEEAHKKGQEISTDKIRSLYENSHYCSGKDDSLTLDDFIKDRQLTYRWTITEINLDLLKDYKNQRVNIKQRRPIHIEYEYNRYGELLQRNFVYCPDPEYFDIGGTIHQNREGDDLPDAGTKFKIGDFVQLKHPMSSSDVLSRFDGHINADDIFVVAGTPFRDKDGRLKENTYHIETVSNCGDYLWDLDFHYPFQGIHESEIVKYEGSIAPDSPLGFLHRVFLGELGDVSEMVRKLENSEISLTPDITWEELQCGSI